ncbi:hypothetical protein BV20DRAFT_446954 [Pilatotrama ljubarskyi]|nr:hypothetical protein BV20DRAFT_446954 [Pilatotrama ljubarskyi]
MPDSCCQPPFALQTLRVTSGGRLITTLWLGLLVTPGQTRRTLDGPPMTLVLTEADLGMAWRAISVPEPLGATFHTGVVQA